LFYSSIIAVEDIGPPRMTIQEKAPLRILSLDGGGVRGISSLYILKDLMARVQRQARVANPTPPTPVFRPCDLFDLICGTSTGGLIAIMLGRLHMVRLTYIRIATIHCLLNYRLLMKPLLNILSSLKRSSTRFRNRTQRSLIMTP